MDYNIIKEIQLLLQLPKHHHISFNLALLLGDNSIVPDNLYVYPIELGTEDISLLEIIRDVNLITKFEILLNENDKDEIQKEFGERDKFWNIYIELLRELIWISYNNYRTIVNTQDYENRKSLFEKKGWHYSLYVDQMGEPFITRYKIFHILSLLYTKPYIRNYYGGCSDIICYANKFLQFWNDSVERLSKLELSIQEDEILNLKSIFSKITDSKIYQDKFNNRYIDGSGCFLKANVIDTTGNNRDVLCFSGLKQHNGNDYLSLAIKQIVDSGVFHNPYLVKVNDKIRYYISSEKYITLGDAKSYGSFFPHRMFSCCERKTFADYDWSNCRSYKMIIKYEPCTLCALSVQKHKTKYSGTILCGKYEHGSSIDKDEFDHIAQEIYESTH